MAKIKYQFNTKSLTYEKIKIGAKERFMRFLSFAGTGLVSGAIGLIIAYNTLDSPRERKLEREVEQMETEYEELNDRIEKMSKVLSDLQDRDNNIYRVVFEADPIPDEVRNAGFGGINRYEKYKNFDNGEMVAKSMLKADILSKKMLIQSKSYDEILSLVKNKSKMLSSIPAIQPISNKTLKSMASGFGFRTDPIYKTSKFHAGMDFSSATGTPVYATGDGTVSRADADASGYGNHIRIDHGYGYLTLYGHLSKINVKPGQAVKRGDVIGLVGNTGKSTGPHLHYEVHKDNEPVNPVNFYYNDLSPEDYEKLLESSKMENQSFD